MRTRKAIAALLLSGAAALGLAGPAAAATGTETFKLVFSGSFVFGSSNTGRAIASGPINAVGAGVNSGFITDPNGQFVGSNVLRFSGGEIRLSFTGGLTSFDFDPRTCVTHITGLGTWKISSATGAYAGTTGAGTFTNDVHLVSRPLADGGCSTSATEITTITLVGPVSTP